MAKRVLVVDDNPVSLKITIGLIHAAGFDADGVGNGEKALFSVAKAPPNLVITGLRLPGMDGLQLTRALKSRPDWSKIPVIVLTAAYSEEEEAEAVKAGCECSIGKPVDTKLFPGMIALFLGAPDTLPPADDSAASALPMQELRDEFLTTSLEECRTVLGGFGDVPDYAAVRKALHRWAGVGGTLGFPAITDLARSLEAMAVARRLDRKEELSQGLRDLLELFGTSKPVVEDAEMPAISSKAPVILVGDDDPVVRGAIKYTLEGAGYRCRLAEDGATTFALARTERPDAVILDLNMPLMDGFQVLYSLRNVWTTRSLPVLILTASHDQADIMRGGLLGASDYMTKPFHLDALVGRIDRLLAG